MGQVVERGTHQELMQSGGKYCHLWKEQQKEKEESKEEVKEDTA